VDFPIVAAGRRVRADIVFPRRRVAVFVDGCFWHCCPQHGRAPANNTEYWDPKLARNVDRDRDTDQALESEGWTVIRIWEHESIRQGAERVGRAVGASGEP
jgi:DNA mismatch endonuclease (patch repair protein)